MPKFLLTCAIVFSAGLAVTDSVVGATLSVEHGLRGENASLAGSDVGGNEEKFILCDYILFWHFIGQC
ncbi:hypothetical protein ON010_g19032 [Phytophthora cinnamomi]|nr:hypothetical protein ON010_g19032 [Phytophthora cinnamomi]